MLNEPASTSMKSSPAMPRGLALLVAAFALVITLMSAVGGCTETPVDGRTADTTLRVYEEDTTVIDLQRLSRDTIIESDRIIIVDTVIREIIVRDTVRLFDTVVVRDTRARRQVREATIIVWNSLTNKLDSVDVVFQPTFFEVSPASPEWRLKFEVTLPLSRLLSEEQFGSHGFSSLTIHIPDAPFRPGSLKLKDNPDFGMGTKLIYKDRVLRTGSDFPSSRNYADFQVRDVNERERTFRVEFNSGFFYSSQSPPVWVRVVMRMTY
jgi:hypothetical protein